MYYDGFITCCIAVVSFTYIMVFVLMYSDGFIFM